MLRNSLSMNIDLSSNKIQSSFHNNKIQISCPNCKQNNSSSNLGVYTCCYQITCKKCFSKGHQKICKSILLGQNKSVNFVLFSNVIKNTNKKQLFHIKPIQKAMKCQFCSNIINKKQLNRCLDCNKNYCKQCCEFIHKRGKFIIHKIQQQFQNPEQHSTHSAIFSHFLCNLHNKQRKYPTKSFSIQCQDCIKQKTGKLKQLTQYISSSQQSRIQFQLFNQNIKHTYEYYNQTCIEQKQKIEEIKEAMKKYYNQVKDKVQQRYHSNVNMINKVENALNFNFNQNLIKNNLVKIRQQVNLIFNLYQQQNKFKQFQHFSLILNTRIQLLKQKLIDTQRIFDEYFLNNLCFQYKLSQNNEMILLSINF